jgi:hypothetical protein
MIATCGIMWDKCGIYNDKTVMANNPKAADNLKPFKKGDPKINRKGRPRHFDALRSLAQQIAHEVATKKDADGNDIPLVIDDHVVTNIEAVMRSWMKSKSPALQQKFVEYAFGKVPDVQELTGKDGGAIEIKGYVNVSPDDWEA